LVADHFVMADPAMKPGSFLNQPFPLEGGRQEGGVRRRPRSPKARGETD